MTPEEELAHRAQVGLQQLLSLAAERDAARAEVSALRKALAELQAKYNQCCAEEQPGP